MLTCRKANTGDMLQYFEWTNDEEVRMQSFQSGKVDLVDHKKWFLSKLEDDNCLMLLFENENKEAVGQVRFQKEDEEGFVVGISVAADFRKQGYAAKLLIASAAHFFSVFPAQKIYAYIKETNIGSVKSFEKAGYQFSKKLSVKGVDSILLIKTRSDENKQH